MLRTCTVCGRRTTGRRCPAHPLERRGHAHAKAARQTLAEETTCWLCGQAARPDDPLEADHVKPRAHGGRDVRSNMRAAHRSCNRSRATGPPEKSLAVTTRK